MKILYISTNFLALTHTFITREINEVRAAGNTVGLLALRRIRPEDETRNPLCDVSQCRYVYPVGFARVLLSFLGMLVRRPVRVLSAVRTAFSDSEDSLMTKFKSGYQLMVTTTLVPWVEAEGFEHLHAHFASPPTTFAMFLHILTGIPYTFTGHGADLFRDRSCLKPKISRATGIVCISEYNKAYYHKLVPNLARTCIVHCGIDLKKFSLREPQSTKNSLFIFGVGRLVPKKGFHVLLEALGKFKEKGFSWSAAIAGDGPLRQELKEQADRLGISENVSFLGNISQEEIRDLLGRADVFVLPSVPVDDGDIDGIPVSLMEAMAVGCPSISTKVSGIPELILDGETGILTEPGDAAGIVEGLCRLAVDPKLVAQLRERGRRKIEQEFNIADVGNKLASFFSSLK
ncbi:MAG: hypothetical protein CSA96_03965 [Bacteroidetes bacterium]|nr:MAG: hypothetical protein CSA96_03965 [Bacteroidota bacterium]